MSYQDHGDPRAQDLQDAHSTLAKTSLLLTNSQALEQAPSPGALQAPNLEQIRLGAAFTYNIQINFSAILGGAFQIVFPGGKNFMGYFGGPVVGVGTTWGTAWLNYSIDQLRGWEARFWANLVPAGCQASLWGMNGEVIGTVAAGGIALAYGTGGGQGKFD